MELEHLLEALLAPMSLTVAELRIKGLDLKMAPEMLSKMMGVLFLSQSLVSQLRMRLVPFLSPLVALFLSFLRLSESQLRERRGEDVTEGKGEKEEEAEDARVELVKVLAVDPAALSE